METGGNNFLENTDNSAAFMVKEVSRIYSEQGAQAAWSQLSAFDHANKTAADTNRYGAVLSELQRLGVLPQLRLAAIERIQQGQNPAVQPHLEAAKAHLPQQSGAPYSEKQLVQDIISVRQRGWNGTLDDAVPG